METYANPIIAEVDLTQTMDRMSIQDTPSELAESVTVNKDRNQKWNDMNAFIIPESIEVKIKEPSKIKIPLMEHQKYSLNYCIQMENTTSFKPLGTDYTIITNKALYCDPVGAGKSLVMLSLISENPVVHTKSQRGVSYSHGISVFEQQQGRDIAPITLIVVPNTLFCQWKSYIQTQTTLKFAFIGKKSDFVKNDFRGLDGILLNCNFYNDLAGIFDELNLSRVIFDEVHMMKIPNSKPIKASFYWFISASPCEIERFTGKRHGFLPAELKSILHITPKCGVIFRNEQKIINMSIKLPRPNTRILSVKMNNILNVLNGIVGNEILESIAAGDVKSAIDKLSLEKTDENNIISVVNKHLQQEMESLELELEAKKIRDYSSKKAKDEALEKVEEKIKETKKKIQDVKDRIFKDNVDPITYDEIVTPVITKCCNNKFEFSTLTEWLLKTKQACPMCRKAMSPKDLVVLDHNKNDGKSEVSDVSPSSDQFLSKPEALEYVIKKLKKASRVLISSGPTGNYAEVLKVMNKNNMTVRQLTGNIQTKNKILEDFKNGALHALYLPAYESGSGLNLIEVTDMILYHKMPSGIEDQVIGRCQRLGRTDPLNLWKIYFENEM